MKQYIILSILYLFIATSSLYAPERAEEDAWQHMTVQEKIDYCAKEISQLSLDLEKARQRLIDMTIWIIERKNGSLEFHCDRISSNPTYTIENIHQVTRNELLDAKKLCFHNNGFNNEEKWAADDLIDEYLIIYEQIILYKNTLARLREKLDEYKPVLRHRTT